MFLCRRCWTSLENTLFFRFLLDHSYLIASNKFTITHQTITSHYLQTSKVTLSSSEWSNQHTDWLFTLINIHFIIFHLVDCFELLFSHHCLIFTSLSCYQSVMSPFFAHAAIVENIDIIRILNRCQAMSNNYRCTIYIQRKGDYSLTEILKRCYFDMLDRVLLEQSSHWHYQVHLWLHLTEEWQVVWQEHELMLFVVFHHHSIEYHVHQPVSDISKW